MKHTKGPWKVERYGESVHDHDIEIWNNNTKIASINQHHEFPDSVNDIANAALISAAPELLLRLTVALDWIDELRVQIPEDVRQSIVDVIDKAKGE